MRSRAVEDFPLGRTPCRLFIASAEKVTGRLEYWLSDTGDGVTELMVASYGPSGKSARSVVSDTPEIYSALKSWLETGQPPRG